MKKWLYIFLLLGVLGLLTGCTQQGEEEEDGYKIWYINQQETKLQSVSIEHEETETEAVVTWMISALRNQPENEKLKSVLPEDVKIRNFQVEHDRLYLNFSIEYFEMPKVYEVLCRAALVRTFCQAPGIDYVGFRVDDQTLMELDGTVIGLMNEDQFIENAGEEINAYKIADLTLYFANATGDRLIKQRVAMEYNSNISLEKLIVECLISGPPFEGAYPTIPPETKLVSITVKDGICYVNLDEGFLQSGYNVTESIPIYSIVNSLIVNTSTQKVQISINGENELLYRESIRLNTVFEKNEELVE